MKKIKRSFLFVWAGLAAGVGAAHAADYFPVATVQTKEGYSLTAVQSGRKDAKTCRAANARFVETLTAGCKTCRVSASRCKSKLTAREQAAIGGKPLKAYSVAAPGVRVVLSGKTDKVRPACEQIAAQSGAKGAKTARCVPPGQPATPS